MKHNTSIEALEQRIAPAAIFTLTDVDGDLVTVKTSKGTNADLAAAMTTSAVGVGGQIRKIDLSTNAAVFAGTDLIVSVVKKPGGDGFVNIGAIDATDAGAMGTALDLGSVVIPGDLGQVDAGDGDSNTPAIKSLKVRSIGALGLATQGGGGDITSTIRGGVGSFAVKGDIRDATILLTNNGAGTEALSKIGTLTIGGSLIGSSSASGLITGATSIGKITIGGGIIGGLGTDSGKISTGDIGSLTIGGNITGGEGQNSGSVFSFATIKTAIVGGSIVGGIGSGAGRITSEGPGAVVVKVAGDLIGNSGTFSGAVEIKSANPSITVGGSLVGGAGFRSGVADFIFGGVAKIGGSIIGGDGIRSGQLAMAVGVGKSVFVGGSVIGGAGGGSGEVVVTGIKTLTVKGSIVGGVGGQSGNVRFGSATSVVVGGSIVGGDFSSGAAAFNGTLESFTGKVGSITIGGSIIGGSTSGSATLQHSGAVLVGDLGKILIKGHIIAGEDNSSGTLKNSGSITSGGSVGSITIKGSVVGSATHRVLFEAVGPGQAPADATVEMAIAKITIGGSVTRADILAGFIDGVGVNGDASIGSVAVKGDWSASSISAGVKDMSGNGFGNGDDAILPDLNNPVIPSRIASIIIGGSVSGSSTAGDSFGFVAQQIGIVKIGGSTIFTGTAATDAAKTLPSVTNDLFIREVA